MNIVMMTNTYKPIVGGLEKSVEIFSDYYRRRGHKVLIVAPKSAEAPEGEEYVVRVPAIQNFNGTDFSVELPVSADLAKILTRFQPDIIHTHHPFLIGDTAMRAAAAFNVPIVFTHHTLYEQNTHYIAGNSKAMKRFVIKLSTGFANLCDQVIAPSESVAKLLEKRGVNVPVAVVPTGIDCQQFSRGKGRTLRDSAGIPARAFLLGIVGRAVPEKNFAFLAKAAALFVKKTKNAYFMVVGDGPSLAEVREIFTEEGVQDYLICTGMLKGQRLLDAYKALDVFVFASHSETQGLVLIEAMAAGTPVVAVNAPGVREVVVDGKNGRLIAHDDAGQFGDALEWVARQGPAGRAALKREARATARRFSVTKSVTRILRIYRDTLKRELKSKEKNGNSAWRRAMRVLRTQTELIGNFSTATRAAIAGGPKKTFITARRHFKKALREIIHSEQG
jgi:glycosyltransferase involved in cell wall biosynthesis